MTARSAPTSKHASNTTAPALTSLSGVGGQMAERLARLGIHSVQDLLFHLPSRYQDRTRVTAIGSLRAGMQAVVVGQVDLTEVVFRRRRSLLSRISDGTGALTLRLFYFSRAQQEGLRRGRWVRCFGEVRRGPATLELIHPEYAVFDARPEPVSSDTLTPLYPSTEGISQALWRRLSEQALRLEAQRVCDLLPESLRKSLDMPDLTQALNYVHRPPVDADLEQLAQAASPAQRRLAFEELLAHHLALRLLRVRRRQHNAPVLDAEGTLVTRLIGQLGFDLTHAQARVIDEVLGELARPVPALRLVQGDVGCGKTVVAAAAVAQTVASGFQAAIMAPTELLAEQHLRSFRGWFAALGIEVGWLSSRVGQRERTATLQALAQGELSVIVGTHALFQEAVRFHQLGLVVVDEQHRFGVDQRLSLREKGTQADRIPHQLVMTATPIPRTLAMAFYADLDVSSIDELPPGRKPVETVVLPDQRRDEVVGRVARACEEGRQVYWVCPLIEESDVLEAQAATDTAEQLQQALPRVRVGLVHGRLKSQQKDAVMQRFRSAELDLLVATTVIEVGVDVPNASLMIIDNAERLGLSQLHQLRGRVGRGSEQAVCVLLYRAHLSPLARRRLSVMRQTNDGFEIARQDLELRGPGELLGTRQTGLQTLRVADLARDRALFTQIEQAGASMLEHFPTQTQQLIERWLGHEQHYGSV